MALTYFLEQFLGLGFLIIGLSLLAERRVLKQIVDELVAHRPLSYVRGMLGLFAGLALVLNYQMWNDGLAPLLITLIGWVLVIKGAVGLFASQSLLRSLAEWSRFDKNYYLYAWILIIVGAYLTYAGFWG